MTSAQRIPNLAPAEWTEDVQALFPLMLPPGSKAKGSDFNSILVLARHPELADPWLRFNAAVGRGFCLPARLKEIAILRVAWHQGSQYEWIHHMLSAARLEMEASEFSALMEEDAGHRFSAAERAVIGATDDICLRGGTSDETWTELSRHLDDKQAMELLFVVGCYVALAAILNSGNVAIEPGYLEQAETLGLPLLDPGQKGRR